jgi:hypothetical protein
VGQPIQDTGVGLGFGRFGEDLGVYQVAHGQRLSEGVGRF